MKYISTLREGERISEVFLVKSKNTAMTKNGKPYDNVILQDKTGTLDAKIWDVGSVGIEEFEALDYVYITGDITSFQGLSYSFYLTETERRHHREKERERKTDRGRQTVTNYKWG